MPGNVNYQTSSYISPFKESNTVTGITSAASGASNYVAEVDMSEGAENAKNLALLLWGDVTNDANATLELFAEIGEDGGIWVKVGEFNVNQSNSGIIEGNHSLGIVNPVPPTNIRISVSSIATDETIDLYWQKSR